MTKTILIAGVNGFVGHHLARELTDAGYTVIGTGLDNSLSPELDAVVSKYYASCDLTDRLGVAKLPLSNVDAVINLAGLAGVGDSFKPGAAERYNHINVAVHTVLAEQLLSLGKPNTRVIAVSTGAVYDNHQPIPITEDGKLITNGSPYALSKIAMEQALELLREQGLDIVVVRPFNHIGPGQLPGFLVPDLITKLRGAKDGDELRVGRLDTRRDYTDVRDVVKAYRLLLETESLSSMVYNVCSGTSHAGQEVLDTLANALNKNGIQAVLDPKLVRPNDPEDVRGDNSLLFKDTGWKPSIDFSQTLQDCARETAG
jgi:GDP-4-dehydro-6-deoxy-D-mannose reductase